MRRYDVVVQRLLPALWVNGFRASLEREPEPGDLVMLQSARPSDWHLSLYRESGPGEGFSKQHLLESLKTGELSWWHNIAFHVIDLERCSISPRLEWSDDQFEFSDKFAKVYKKGGFYLEIPFIDRFDGDMVILKFRTRHNIDDRITELPPIPWRKITQKRLLSELTHGELVHSQGRGKKNG